MPVEPERREVRNTEEAEKSAGLPPVGWPNSWRHTIISHPWLPGENRAPDRADTWAEEIDLMVRLSNGSEADQVAATHLILRDMGITLALAGESAMSIVKMMLSWTEVGYWLVDVDRHQTRMWGRGPANLCALDVEDPHDDE